MSYKSTCYTDVKALVSLKTNLTSTKQHTVKATVKMALNEKTTHPETHHSLRNVDGGEIGQ